MPKQLKIGGHIYKIIEAPNWEGSDDGDMGETFYFKQEIYINSKLPESEKMQTLLHEILHVINSSFTEVFIDGFSAQLYQVLKDNKLKF